MYMYLHKHDLNVSINWTYCNILYTVYMYLHKHDLNTIIILYLCDIYLSGLTPFSSFAFRRQPLCI